MAAGVVDPLAHVLARAQRVLGVGPDAEDGALAVAVRFLVDDEPRWLRGRPEVLRLDVLTVCELVARRRA